MPGISRNDITGLILAGGRGHRLEGQDKGLLPLGGRRMIEHVIDGLRQHVDSIVINANRNVATYEALGYPVVSDEPIDFSGPLAGIAAGLTTAKTPYVMVVPCDVPYVPADLVDRLSLALVSSRADAAAVRSGDNLQPLHVLLTRQVLCGLQPYRESGKRQVQGWLSTLKLVTVPFDNDAPAFLNVNDPSTYRAIATESLEFHCPTEP